MSYGYLVGRGICGLVDTVPALAHCAALFTGSLGVKDCGEGYSVARLQGIVNKVPVGALSSSSSKLVYRWSLVTGPVSGWAGPSVSSDEGRQVVPPGRAGHRLAFRQVTVAEAMLKSGCKY